MVVDNKEFKALTPEPTLEDLAVRVLTLEVFDDNILRAINSLIGKTEYLEERIEKLEEKHERKIKALKKQNKILVDFVSELSHKLSIVIEKNSLSEKENEESLGLAFEKLEF